MCFYCIPFNAKELSRDYGPRLKDIADKDLKHKDIAEKKENSMCVLYFANPSLKRLYRLVTLYHQSIRNG